MTDASSRSTKRLPRIAWPGVAVAAIVACSNDGARTESPPASSSSASKTPLVVWVLDEGLTAFDPPTPLAGVEIAFDPPDGLARELMRTEADGHVVVEADFTREGAAITAASPDHVIVSALNISPTYAHLRPNTFGKPAEDIVLVPPRLDRAILGATVELRGALAGKAEKSAVDVSVSALRRLGNDTTTEGSYVLRAPRGRPFVLFGHEQSTPANPTELPELIKSFRIDVPARDTDGVLDIDIGAAAALPTKPVRIHADVPIDEPFGTPPDCLGLVKSAESTLLVGGFRRQFPNTGGCDVEMTVADANIEPESTITSVVLTAFDGSRSVRTERGVLADGAKIDNFLIPPTIVEASRTIQDAIPIERINAGTDVHVDVFAGNQLLWVLDGPIGRLRKPALNLPAPFGVTFTVDVNLFAITITARADGTQLPSGKMIWGREATSRDVLVRRR
jgi:hypothetical protein